jgi:exopolyphosphatase/guanosine-5'-triphosphate,3'-diphosphate pyrophosphatase
MQRARVAARQAIEPYQAAFRRRGFDEAVGSSGTVRAIGDTIRELDPSAVDIGADGSNASSNALSELEHIRDLKLNAITDDRKLSFAGGVAILAEVFEQLGIETMRVPDGAMREGLLYDLLGRYTDEDAANEPCAACRSATTSISVRLSASRHCRPTSWRKSKGFGR